MPNVFWMRRILNPNTKRICIFMDVAINKQFIFTVPYRTAATVILQRQASAAHLGGFVHGAGKNEGAVPVQLNIGDLTTVSHQCVDTSGNRTHTNTHTLVLM